MLKKLLLSFIMIMTVFSNAMGMSAMETLKVEISANDFAVNLAEAATLDAETAKDENHAAIALLNQVTREYAVPFVTVDEAELKAINEATEDGSYPLTFRINHMSYNDEKTITVTIVDNPQGIVPISGELPTTEMNLSSMIFQVVIKLVIAVGLIGLGAFLVIKYRKN